MGFVLGKLKVPLDHIVELTCNEQAFKARKRL